ncbi:DNA polymerase III subunit epsilon, partial [Salmonella enterica]
LLDAELLADVYINLTRGQDALLISDDAQEGDDASLRVAPVDLSAFTLPVLLASEQELAAHGDVLTQIDKASGGKTIWKISAEG